MDKGAVSENFSTEQCNLCTDRFRYQLVTDMRTVFSSR